MGGGSPLPQESLQQEHIEAEEKDGAQAKSLQKGCGGGDYKMEEAGDAIAGEARVFYRRHSLCSLCVDSSIEQILYRSGDAVA